MGYKIGSKLAFMLFLFLLMTIMFSVAFSIYVFTDPDYPIEEYYTASGTHVTIHHDETMPTINLYICTPLIAILTIVSFFDWKRKKRYDELVEDLPSYVKMYRRASLEKMARRMNISVKEVDFLLQDCVKKGTVKGHFDYAAGEFVLEGTQYVEAPQLRKCPNCGGQIDNKFLEGEEMKCEYCNIILVQKKDNSNI